MAYIKGIDISVLQAKISFQSMVAEGIQFCVCRCGVGNSSIDVNYASNIRALKAVNVYPAAYHFIYPLPSNPSQPLRDPIKQANYHWNAAQGELACIDCEWPSPPDLGKWGCSAAQINQWMISYFQEYTRLDNGRKPICYTYPYWASAIKFDPSFAQYPLWIASYEPTPSIPLPWSDWQIWQNTGGTQTIDGIAVDTDLAKDLSLWNIVSPVSPPTDPAPINDDQQSSIEIGTHSSAAPTAQPEKSNILTEISDFVSDVIEK